MEVLTQTQKSIEQCIAGQYFSVAHLHREEPEEPMHSHWCCEFYYSVSGGRTFLIDDKLYRIEPGCLFMINQYEAHQISQLDAYSPNERIVIMIHPKFLEKISTEDSDLSYCFTHRPERFSHRLALDAGQQRRFGYYINKITSADGFGKDLAERCAFVELMIFLTSVCMENENQTPAVLESPGFNPKVADIILYIHQNIDASLTIGQIASHFYLSEAYLCRLFKKSTGTTINRYITRERIERAKILLSNGCSVNEVYGSCGFNDYSNFFKAFTKQVGISPKKYSQNSLK